MDILYDWYISSEQFRLYLIAVIIIYGAFIFFLIYNLEKLTKRVNMYDRYFKAAGIVITRDDIEQMLKTKKSPGPTCAPGGPEDRL